ncbi:MAG: Chromosomal replication initiator protein DnaA [Candidatus Wolfebacteria bacterium GW2011_GWA2_42_10]|uniref:Chromosomal replication initiator protein DnaA n=2 Tax=Candidatus Wolfeibacteriota TaxID=1752735 RepID=A0A0G0ZTK3_9BACT|nr:MAG: Chromosomal replication initiator protein DnaA [Candidatus Wolfebacteria bacterium GW2011_GWB1_41_12]KKS25311.1 MAG: Chromosomal replication initiator protein DnaA [Candidatus Wolfebacteria bacterium GW2011_GWA2_42_10]KKT56750.1 MAG: Chromosomal replication initiator protein DnaA [Candidatus Wolfebacteria bacterium GW2011_GWA1_44_24]
MNSEQLWETTLSELELQISRANFLTWLKNSRLLEKKDGGEVLIGLANNFAKEWVENKYHKMIFEILKNHDDSVKKIEYTVVGSKISFSEKNFSENKERQPTLPEFKVDPETGLHPRYVLNSFVVGSSNELAYAASLAVVKNVGSKYNPLFIYGGTGLGKTHLIQAIGNEIKKIYKNKVKVKYVHCEKFVNEVVSGIRNKRMEDIKDRYRSIDVLIIDDIQFIGGKERSEEEFFHTFNVLHENNKQIIISSDRPPASLPTLHERLRSRFEGGMAADITYPDFETRMAIIKTKLAEIKGDLPDNICQIIASRVQRNIREIEGILNKILFYGETKRIGLDSKTVEEIIDNTIKRVDKKVTPNQIIGAVANFFEVLPEDISNHSRRKKVIEPRQISIFLLREILGMSYPDIGEKIGKRDHTTAIHSYEKILRETNKNQPLNQKIALIKELIYENQ